MIVSNRPPFCKSFVSDSLRKNDKAKEIVNSRKIQSLFFVLESYVVDIIMELLDGVRRKTWTKIKRTIYVKLSTNIVQKNVLIPFW